MRVQLRKEMPRVAVEKQAFFDCRGEWAAVYGRDHL